jgi:GT2 family glycosyltransferase
MNRRPQRLPGRAPVKIADVELAESDGTVLDLGDLRRYRVVLMLVRFEGTPLGMLTLPVVNGGCSRQALCAAVLREVPDRIVSKLMVDALLDPVRGCAPSVSSLQRRAAPRQVMAWPSVTVVVCTRDRPKQLAQCLGALVQLDYQNLELLVVDNAPQNDAAVELVAQYPGIRYVREPRPGLDWARNRGVLEACGDIVAFTDDDTVVDPGWLRALATVFAEDPEVMAVTGLVAPLELETDAQLLFEHYGGFGRGFDRRWYGVNALAGQRAAHSYGGTGVIGTGANMAYRRSVFDAVGLFDPALDVGTVTNGGGDLEMFFRVVKAGLPLVYEPQALVWHQHRRTMDELREQLTNHGVGFASYVMCSSAAYPEERDGFAALVRWWLGWMGRRLGTESVRPGRFPASLVRAELRGFMVGIRRYRRARAAAMEIERSFGPLAEAWPAARLRAREASAHPERAPRRAWPTAVRAVDLAGPLQPLTSLDRYGSVQVTVLRHGALLGQVDLHNWGRSVSAQRLAQAIIDQLGMSVLAPPGVDPMELKVQVRAAVTARAGLKTVLAAPDRDHGRTSISVVIATRDRPDELRACLTTLTAQHTDHRVEVVVADNNPQSGITRPVVAEFDSVTLVEEERPGLSYARNAGIAASSGDIVVTTDDDVTMPHDWLDRLVAPFRRSDVMAVTGNVLPSELESEAQRLFEAYGGLGRGFKRREFDMGWFEQGRKACRTWMIGAGANAAFRAEVFADPEIGLFEETLGAGTPAGVGEDTYLFYRLLKAGHQIVYEPSAYVWHRHRRDLAALRRQIWGYSAGHVAYHMTTFLQDQDVRGLWRIGVELPRGYLGRLRSSLRGRNNYPASLILYEAVASLTGPWSWLVSRRRVRRLGRSAPNVPPAMRGEADAHSGAARQGEKPQTKGAP